MKYIVNGTGVVLCIILEILIIAESIWYLTSWKTHALFMSGFYSAFLIVVLIVTINDAYEKKIKIERRVNGRNSEDN